jgi:energy-coupling factor transporter ATP-binding protein EcfA2
MIAFNNFSYTYLNGEGGVQNIHLKIRQGEFVVLCGRSGCGKTTLIRAINGLAFHFYKGRYSGEALIDNTDISEIPSSEICLKVGSVFQDPRSQFFDKRVEGEIAFGCENIGLLPEEIRRRTNAAAESLSLAPLKARRLIRLSSGEKQKTAIASICAMGPQIYVLDEPSSNLDGRATKELAATLSQLKAAGKTIVVAEHRVNYLADLADRFVYINEGQIEEQFSAGEFLALSDKALARRGLRCTKQSVIDHKAAARDEHSYFMVDHLCAAYQKPLFSGFCLSADRGHVAAITGANGMGKTTLCRILSGLKKEKSGEIRLQGKTLGKNKRLRHMYLVLNGADNRSFTSSVSEEPLLGLDRKAAAQKRAACDALLRKLNLSQLSDRHPLTLSGGQKQRLSIATALMQEREIIILDEPTSGLDYDNMVQVSAAIRSAAEQGKVVLVVSHDVEFINVVADRVFQL